MPPIKTQARAATILPNFVGLIFQVHNGKSYQDVRITEDMVGHKLGEFSAYAHNRQGKTEARSDTQQHPETLHLQADQEQVNVHHLQEHHLPISGVHWVLMYKIPKSGGARFGCLILLLPLHGYQCSELLSVLDSLWSESFVTMVQSHLLTDA